MRQGDVHCPYCTSFHDSVTSTGLLHLSMRRGCAFAPAVAFALSPVLSTPTLWVVVPKGRTISTQGQRYLACRRPHPLICGSPSAPEHERPSSAEKRPVRRETDPRGFVLPVPGDVVLYAGRWADEDAAGLVEAVRPRAGNSTAFVVDIVEMRDVGDRLFATTRRRRWFDVGDVRIALDAEYVPSQDAYTVLSARHGYAAIPEMDAESKAVADAEYASLKARMLKMTAIAGLGGTSFAAVLLSTDLAISFGLGSAASLAYLYLLQLTVDTVGDSGGENFESRFASRFVVLRFAVPALPFLALALTNYDVAAIPSSASVLGPRFGVVSPQQAAAAILGLLTYKVPLLSQTGGEAVDSLAEMPLNTGTGGMLGTFAGVAARAVRGLSAAGDAPPTAASAAGRSMLFVFAGPSGSGKSSLIRQLFKDCSDLFGFSVSHTTRAPRDGEVDGVDYHFVEKREFEAMVDAGEFVEHAIVHGNLYGTSYAAVAKVFSSGKCCVLDLDVQGVMALAQRGGEEQWSPRFVWVSPPSINALRKRLEARGTETAEALAKRLDTATREIAFAATSRVFDLTLINDDFSVAYGELLKYVQREMRSSSD
jgi:guanylate kinase